jgi:hypothetical protein
VFELTLTANATFTFANVSAGRAITLLLIQDGTGGRTATWPGAVDWPNATAPRLSSTAADVDLITLICQNDGSTVSGSAGGLDVVEQQFIETDASQTDNPLQIQDSSDNNLVFVSTHPTLGVGSAASGAITRFIDIDGTLESGSAQAYGILSTPSAGSTVTGYFTAFYGRADVDAGTTLTNSLAFWAGSPVVAGTLTTAVGFWCDSITTGGTNNYAIYTNLGDVRFGDEVVIASPTAGALTIGAGTAGIDYTLTFDGETNNGVLTWMEDEDYFKFDDDVMIADGENVVLDTTTGTKIGTATSQKLGFFNATPVVQQAHIADADGTLADVTSKFNTLLAALEALGLLASA